jgi:hypothetical protein
MGTYYANNILLKKFKKLICDTREKLIECSVSTILVYHEQQYCTCHQQHCTCPIAFLPIFSVKPALFPPGV